MKTNNKPELLAPAGNMGCALAAFDAGADAVYAGLDRFNAREKSTNFTTEEFEQLIAYAHKNGKKVYLTLNTLIKEDEIKDVVEILAEVAFLRPDAVIVQDFGIVQLLRTYFPELAIHGSTQMGLHNSAGVNMAKSLGVERVILERQVTLDEMAEVMTNVEDSEVEVFVHGALCCSLSGVCTFSSWLGGWSGNRGKCKQPCRRRFYSEDGNGFFFSAQDLYTLDMVGKFKEMGVHSLKIEGRLKKADYISNVVKAYRMVIDAEDSNDEEILQKARVQLSQAPGRKWSHGFYTDESQKSLIEHYSLGVAGQLSGDVVGTGTNRYMVKVSRRLHLGDRVRIQAYNGDGGPAMTITKMYVDNRPVTKAVKGETCTILYDREVPHQGQVYKVGTSTEDMTARIAALPDFRPEVDLSIEVSDLSLVVSVVNQGLEWSTEVNFQPAQKRACSAEDFVSGFKAIGGSSFKLGKIKIKFDSDLFIPNSVLKQYRKQFWAWLEDEIDVGDLRIGHPGLLQFYTDYRREELEGERELEELNLYRSDYNRGVDVYMAKPESHLPDKHIEVCRSIFSYDKKTKELALPLFCPEDRLKALAGHIERAYDKGIRNYRVTSFYQFELLKKYEDVNVMVSSPLPVCNSLTANLFQELGALKVQPWVEMDQRSIDLMVERSPITVEVYRYGRIPLLITRAQVAISGKIKDNRGNQFHVIYDKFSKLTYVYSNEVLIIPKVNNTDNFYDLTNASWGSKETSSFNFNTEFV
ncbi:MAG: U32 family peptidase [Lentisphaeria bacterium]|nr:U32 family peptidase [Lentisphaeria bacterium]